MKKMCARNIKLQESVGAKLTIMPGDLGTISDRRSLAQKKNRAIGTLPETCFLYFLCKQLSLYHQIYAAAFFITAISYLHTYSD
jgi:hypothetical protein